MVAALEKSLGRVTEAAAAVDIVRQTHYNWLRDDPEYKEAVDAVGEHALDFVEGKLFELIDGATHEVATKEGIETVKDAPNPTACIFYLKTKGKKRGYIERQEITGPEDGPINIVVSKLI